MELCGSEIPDSEFVNKLPEEATEVSRSGNVATVTVKLVDHDADQKINVTSASEYFDGTATSWGGNILNVMLFPRDADHNPLGVTIDTALLPKFFDPCEAYPCCLRIEIDGKFILWSFRHEDFYNPFNALPAQPMTEEEWNNAVEEYNNMTVEFNLPRANLHYCGVVTESAIKRVRTAALGGSFSDPDFGPWEGPIQSWPCVDNGVPPDFPTSCWRYRESNPYGYMEATYIDEGEVCVPVPEGSYCTHYFAGVLEHDLYNKEEEFENFILSGSTIDLSGMLEDKLYRKITKSGHPDHPGIVLDHCETFQHKKISQAEEIMVCLAPGEVTSDLHPIFETSNPRVGSYEIYENLAGKYFTANTVSEFTTYDVGVRTSLISLGDHDFSGTSSFDAAAYISGAGSLGIAYLFEEMYVHDGSQYLETGLRLLAFNGGFPSTDQGDNLLWNHRLSDAISVNIDGLNGLLHKFGYYSIDEFFSSRQYIGAGIGISIICPAGCGRECGY